MIAKLRIGRYVYEVDDQRRWQGDGPHIEALRRAHPIGGGPWEGLPGIGDILEAARFWGGEAFDIAEGEDIPDDAVA